VSSARKVAYGKPPIRFMAHVDVDGPVPEHDPTLGACWLWTGAVGESGYPEFRYDTDRTGYAHRWVYEHAVGPIPDGWHVDHECHDWATCARNAGACAHRACVNPAHLRARTPADNNARSDSPTARNARKTRCDAGHDLDDPANVYIHPQRGTRHCRICQTERAQRYEQQRARRRGAMVKRRASAAPGEGQLSIDLDYGTITRGG